jgi:hypothetical protein
MNRSLFTPFASNARRPSARTTPLFLAGLLLTACTVAAETAAPQAPATPQWAPEQVAAPQLPKITTPEQAQVRDRATARWQTLMVGDFVKAYAFTTPALKRNTTEAAYLARFESKPQWNGAEVVAVTCATPDSCVARVRVDFKFTLPRTTVRNIVTHVDEAWLLDEGQWWLSDDTPR